VLQPSINTPMLQGQIVTPSSVSSPLHCTHSTYLPGYTQPVHTPMPQVAQVPRAFTHDSMISNPLAYTCSQANVIQTPDTRQRKHY